MTDARPHDALGGFLRDVPAAADGAARAGVALWRAMVFLVPALSVLAGLVAHDVAMELRASAEDMLGEPFLILISFGLLAIVALMLLMLAVVAETLALTAFVLALPLGLALNWALGAYLRPDAESRSGPLVTLGLVALGGMPVGVVLGTVFPPLALLALAPFATFAFAFAGRRSLAPARPLAVAGAPEPAWAPLRPPPPPPRPPQG